VPTLFESAKNNPPKKVKAVKARKNIPVMHPHMGPFTSYAVHPDGVRFETQEEKEIVVLFLRQHIIVNVPWIILAALMLLAPTIIFPFVFNVIHMPVTIPIGYIIVGTIWWYVATAGYILAKFLGWIINIYIVTNERIVDIDFYYLLYKHFSEAEINKIQDISYTSKGIFAAVFNYGDVIIETAGEAPNLVFESVPHPDTVVETIRNILEGHEVPV
jgi:hypothetical protein